MAGTKKVCRTCNKDFLIIDQEQSFLNERGLPFPDECPPCRQARREKMRGGRKLYRSKCQDCNKDIIVSYDPSTVKSKIMCFECYRKYSETHEFLIKDDLLQTGGEVIGNQDREPPLQPVQEPVLPTPLPRTESEPAPTVKEEPLKSDK